MTNIVVLKSEWRRRVISSQVRFTLGPSLSEPEPAGRWRWGWRAHVAIAAHVLQLPTLQHKDISIILAGSIHTGSISESEPEPTGTLQRWRRWRAHAASAAHYSGLGRGPRQKNGKILTLLQALPM